MPPPLSFSISIRIVTKSSPTLVISSEAESGGWWQQRPVPTFSRLRASHHSSRSLLLGSYWRYCRSCWFTTILNACLCNRTGFLQYVQVYFFYLELVKYNCKCWVEKIPNIRIFSQWSLVFCMQKNLIWLILTSQHNVWKMTYPCFPLLSKESVAVATWCRRQ